MTRATRTRGEDGVALVMAIVIMILVIGFISVYTLVSSSSRDELVTERGRMQSEVWADAAGDDIAQRLERGEIGFQSVATTLDGKQGRLLQMRVPGTSVAHGAGSCPNSFPISTSGGGSGFYCVLSPGGGLGPGGFLNLDPADPAHGTTSFVVRAWGTQGTPRPLGVELTFGRSSLARFAVLSDAPITLDKTVGAGSLVLPAGARLHSNNTSNATHGIFMRGAVNHAGASRITTTRSGSGQAVSASAGAAPCANGPKCYVSGTTVSFNSTFTAFNRIAKADPGGMCSGGADAGSVGAFRMCRIASGYIFPGPAIAGMPVFVVNVNGACVAWTTARFPLRQDSYSYPITDDSVAPIGTGGGGNFCPASGGGALMFEGDVLLRGNRAVGSPSVTIMARRPTTGTNQRVLLPSGTSAQVSEAASIYLDAGSGAIGGAGTGSTASTLGVVAEGGVYLPTYAAVGNFTIRRSAIIAAGSSFSMGPSFQQVAGDTGVVAQGGTEISAGGIDPCSPAAGLPVAGTLNFSGTFASRQLPFLTYTGGGCTRGYQARSYQFDTELGWNPPPFYPAPTPWHVVDSRVFST
jgi:hypothetical protein